MIKTKSAFIISVLLCLIIFPYHIAIFFIDSDYLFSIIPGWHTTIIPGQIISNLIKFLALVLTTFCYWNLSKIEDQLSLKNFLIYLSLTIPALFVGKINLYVSSVAIIYLSPESFINQIQNIVLINICCNVLFFISQILFWRFYFQSKKSVEK